MATVNIPDSIQRAIITVCKVAFVVITALAAVVALVACFTDVHNTMRYIVIGIAVACIGVITTWRVPENENNNPDAITDGPGVQSNA